MLAEVVCTATGVLEREILTVPQLLMYSKGVKCYSNSYYFIRECLLFIIILVETKDKKKKDKNKKSLNSSVLINNSNFIYLNRA